MKSRRKLSAIILFICFLPLADSASACTIFTVADGQSIFFCGNEDNSEAFQWRIWFDPASRNRHGRVFLGFRIVNNLDVPMAGFNDQGLAIDLNAVAYTPITTSSERENYYGAIFTKWLADCATVNEVKDQLSLYNIIDLEKNPNQIHVADKTGNAMVVAVNSDGELSTTNISGNYLVSTNFNLNDKEQLAWELQDNGRYNTTVTGLETLLNHNNLSVEGCRDILEETALNPNLGYGYVADMKNGLIYLYSHDDFERTAILNIHEELAKGVHSYALETLVTQQTGVIKPYIRNSVLISILIIILASIISISLYLISLRPLFQSTPTKGPDNVQYSGFKPLIINKLRTIQPRFRFLIATLLSISLFLVLKAFIKIGPLYVKEDWTSIIYFYLTIVPILVISTNFRPSFAFILSSLGIIVDELTFCFIHGYGGELWIQLIIALTSLVGTTVIISAVRKKNTFLAFLLGGFWYILGFYVPSYLYYCIMFNYDAVGLFLYNIAHVLVYIIFIPVILLSNKVIQGLSHKQDLEALVFSQDS
ncbi:MAG: hypothetical protein ACFFDT_05210 [Candidatus Hodarchaeota archaeon]